MNRCVIGVLVVAALWGTAAEAQTITGRIDPVWDPDLETYIYGYDDSLLWRLQVAPSSARSDELSVYLYYNKRAAAMAMYVLCREDARTDLETHALSFSAEHFLSLTTGLITGEDCYLLLRGVSDRKRSAVVSDGGFRACCTLQFFAGKLKLRCQRRSGCRDVFGCPAGFTVPAAHGARQGQRSGGSRVRFQDSAVRRSMVGLFVVVLLCGAAAEAQTVAAWIEPVWDAEKGLYTYGPLYWDLEVAPSLEGSDEFSLNMYYNRARALMAATVACRDAGEDFAIHARSFSGEHFLSLTTGLMPGQGVRAVPGRRQRKGRTAGISDGGLGARNAHNR